MVVRDCDPQDPEQVGSSNCCHSLIIIGSYQVNFDDNLFLFAALVISYFSNLHLCI